MNVKTGTELKASSEMEGLGVYKRRSKHATREAWWIDLMPWKEG